MFEFIKNPRLPKFLRGRPDESARIAAMDESGFLTMIEIVAVDEPLPFDLIPERTLVNIVQRGFAFYDKVGQRWYLTPAGKQHLEAAQHYRS